MVCLQDGRRVKEPDTARHSRCIFSGRDSILCVSTCITLRDCHRDIGSHFSYLQIKGTGDVSEAQLIQSSKGKVSTSPMTLFIHALLPFCLEVEGGVGGWQLELDLDR